MDSFQNRLKQSIENSNLSQSEIARRLGIGRSTISGWLKGEYEPNSENIFKLARFFDVSEAWLLGFVDDKHDLKTFNIKPKEVLALDVPLLNVSAGNEEADFSQTNETVEAPTHLSHYGQDLFAVRVCGDSMNKILPSGSIVICVKVYDEPKTGDIVIYRNENEIAIKRYIRTEQIVLFEPVSYNDEYKTMVYDANGEITEIEILGVVKHNFTNF